MRLTDIQKDLGEMTDEELILHLKALRSVKLIDSDRTAKRKEKTKKVVIGLSDAQLMALAKKRGLTP